MRTFELSEIGHKHTFPVRCNVHAEHTGLQQLEILELEGLGRTLVLDNIIQLSELDDAKYHEMMVHPVVSSLGSSKNALVIGGGDGCLVRELLKYSDMHVTLVEIDERVIEASCKYLDSLNEMSFKDSRCSVFIADACEWIIACEDDFDAIFLDITDPQHNTPSANIITDKVMSALVRRMRPSGILVTQSDNPDICPEQTQSWKKTLEQHFQNVQVYGVPCLSYGSAINFVAGSNGAGVQQNVSLMHDLKWLNNKRLQAAFSLYGEDDV